MLFLSLVVFVAINCTYTLYKTQLYNLSGTKWIPNLQKHHISKVNENDNTTYPYIEAPFVEFCSDYLEYIMQYAPTIFFMLKTNQRARAFYYIVLSIFIALLNNGMKIAWR